MAEKQQCNSSKILWTEGLGGAAGGAAGAWMTGASHRQLMFGSGAFFLANLGMHAYYADTKWTDKKDGKYVVKFYKYKGTDKPKKGALVKFIDDFDAKDTGVAYTALVGGCKGTGEGGYVVSDFQVLGADVALSALAGAAGLFYAGANMKEILAGTAGAVVGAQIVSGMSDRGKAKTPTTKS